MSLISEFAEVAAQRPRQIALITERSQLDYSDILNLVQLFDVELTTRGVRPGQTVVLDSTRAEFCVAFSLLLSLRGLTVAFTTTKQAIESGLEFDRVVTTQSSDMVAAERQILVDASWFEALGTYPLTDFTAHGEARGKFVTTSSGSTGRPKLVLGTEEERIRTAHRGAGFGDVSHAGRRFCSSLSPQAGWSITGNLASLLAGGSALSLSDDSEKLPAYLDLYRVDLMITTPGTISYLLDIPRVSQYLASLRDIRIGGAAVTQRLIREFGKVCGARIHVGYGAAEIGTVLMSVQDPSTPAPQGYLGTPARDDIEVAFFDEDLTPLPDASEGVVGFRLKNESMAREYLGASKDPAGGLIGEYFFPGDIMRREADGYYYVGRIKNIINISGNKYSLEAVAATLEADFADIRCVPLVDQNSRGVEQLVVAYVAGADVDKSDFERSLVLRFPGLLVQRAERIQEVPMTPNGKIDMTALRERLGLAEGSESRDS